MPYVTIADREVSRIGKAEGLVEGRREAIQSILRGRFAPAVPVLMPRVLEVQDPDRLQQIVDLAVTGTLDEIAAAVEAAVPPPK